MGGASSGMAFSHEQPDVDFREFLDSQRETYELMLNQKLSLETQIEVRVIMIFRAIRRYCENLRAQ